MSGDNCWLYLLFGSMEGMNKYEKNENERKK